MKYSLLLLLLLITVACVNSNNFGEVNKPLQNSHVNKVEESRKYRFFDLFTMSGKEAYDGDSCVIVIQKHDTITLEIQYPLKYRLVLLHQEGYWYSYAEFDIDRDKSAMSKSDSWPRRYDRFIFNNTIYEYEQIYSSEMVFKTLYIKKPQLYEVFDLESDNTLDTNPKLMLNKIQKIIKKTDIKFESVSSYDVIRNRTSLQVVSRKTDFSISYTYPELQIWGLPYGL